MPDVDLEQLILGQWITSFDLQLPGEGTLLPCAFLSCYVFMRDHKFVLYQHRNKGSALDYKERRGRWSIDWDGQAQIPMGVIAIESHDRLALRFYLRNRSELIWLMVSLPDPADAPNPIGGSSLSAPLLHAPIAQGRMFRAELAHPFQL